MTFDNLDTGLQAMLLYNYNSMSKFLIILFILVISLIYLYFIRPTQKETDNMVIGLYRVLAYTTSYLFLVATPILFIFITTPGYSNTSLLLFVLSMYIIFIVMFTMYWILNIVTIPISLFKVAGLSNEKLLEIMNKRVKLK